ncbi:ribonuclease HI family protein [Patescibacteria group bacterium]|nr:ribonuclease HI family protein [Patescibacteria group bacterium]
MDGIQNIVIFSDGGSRGNPGPSAGGAVIYFDRDKSCQTTAKYYGRMTNNQAEYRALLDGLLLLEKCLEEDFTKVVLSVFLDSELMVKQINGEYKVKNDGLRDYYQDIQKLLSKYGQVTVSHVNRGNNQLADSLVNEVLDRWGE